MANRSYLYSLSNRPTSYADRPETISGLSEWAYDVPFIYRLLMSSDPQLCASLISDSLDDAEAPLHAISSPFDPGFERVKRFVAILKVIIAPTAAPSPSVQPEQIPESTVMTRLRSWVGLAPQPAPISAPAPAPVAAPAALEHLPGWLDETIEFLETYRNQYLLLETIELDVMSESEPDALRALVEDEINRCREVGAAFEALPQDITEAARILQRAAAESSAPPLNAFFGLRFDDDCDGTRTNATECPLGLAWSDVLYFDLFNREQFEAPQREQD